MRVLIDQVRGNEMIADSCRLAAASPDAERRVVVLDCPLDQPETRAALAALQLTQVDRWILTSGHTVGEPQGGPPWSALLPAEAVEAGVQLATDERQAIIDARACIGSARGNVLVLTDQVERVCRALDHQGIAQASGVAAPPAVPAIGIPRPPLARASAGAPDPGTAPPVQVPLTRLRVGIELAATYLSEACGADGRFVYRAAPDPAVRLKPRYNLLRHAGAIYALAQYCGQRSSDPRVADAMRRAVVSSCARLWRPWRISRRCSRRGAGTG